MTPKRKRDESYSSPIAELFVVNTPSVLTENSLSEAQAEGEVDNFQDGTLTF